MPVFDPYKYVSDLGVAQRQAGVDRVVRELVCAYAKLAVEEGQPPVFYSESISEKDLSLCPEVVDVQTRCSALDLRFLDFLSRYAGDLREKDLPPVFDRYQLASFLDINMKQLVHLTHNQPGYYKQFKIPKRSGGSRFIDAPKYQLKNIHRKILWDILYHIPCERAAKGFISGTSIRDNAELHVGKRVVLRTDLENFFPSITFKQVRKVFEKIGYPYSVSLALANICTLKGKLPQGAPTSPKISAC